MRRAARPSLLLLLASLLAAPPLVGQTTLRNRVDLEYAWEWETERSQKLEAVWIPTLESRLGKACDFFGQVRLRGETEGLLEPGEPDYPNYSDINGREWLSEEADAELREFWLRCSSSHFFLTLGKQQVVWGKADGLKILDVVNPQSFREFILDEFEDSRIPLWTVNAEISWGTTNLQLLFIPDTTYHEFPQAGALFAITSPLLLPQVPPGVDAELLPFQKPDDAIEDADYGARLSTFLGGWDLSFAYLHHYEDTPVFALRPGSTPGRVAVLPTWERSDLFGFTFSNAFGSLTLRGEVGYTLDKDFTITDPSRVPLTPEIVERGLVESDELAYVIGLDWYGMRNSLLSFQLFESRLQDDPLPLFRPEVDTVATALWRRWSADERFQVELFWLHGTEFEDGLVRPEVKWLFRDWGQVYLGADVFYGEAEGLFGQFEERDRATLGWRFDF